MNALWIISGELSSRVLSVLMSSVRDSFSLWAQTTDSNNTKVILLQCWRIQEAEYMDLVVIKCP